MTRARALWKYNELVLTNYGAHFSEHFETSYKTHEGGGRAMLVLVRRLVSLLPRCYRGHSSLEVSVNS